MVEPDAEGLHIYRRTLGVMTNSPGYPWHRQNLLNYAGIRAEDYPTVGVPGRDARAVLFRERGAGPSGGTGVPPSRFVRLAFLKKYAVPGKDEPEGVSRMMRLFQSAAFPLGLVQVSHTAAVTALDRDVLPYDYTVYTAVYCAESLRAYWTTYDNHCIRRFSLADLADRREPLSVPLAGTQTFEDVTPV